MGSELLTGQPENRERSLEYPGGPGVITGSFIMGDEAGEDARV